MTATEVLLIRHGQSEGNEGGRFGGHGPTPLTALGHRQARAAGEAIAAEGGLDVIYGSDLKRAMQTAEPICAATGLILRTTAALRERHVGIFTGMTFAEAEAQHPVEFAAMMARDIDAAPPEGESPRERMTHVARFFDDAVAKHEGERICFVSHAFTLNLLLRHLLGMTSPQAFIRSDNCALHRLRRQENGFWNVLALNDKRHLVGL
jgi:2,3-bisphosphoglycerate-dependent phosphoglycerate mutase